MSGEGFRRAAGRAQGGGGRWLLRVRPSGIGLAGLVLPGSCALQQPSSTPAVSPTPALSVHPSLQLARMPGDCGTGPMVIDYAAGAGEATPEEAVRGFIELQRAVDPPDAKGVAEREAILASAPLLVEDGLVDGKPQYSAQDEDGVLGLFYVTAPDRDGYVVSAYWVRLPEEFC